MKSIQNVLRERKQIQDVIELLLDIEPVREHSRASINEMCDTLFTFFPVKYEQYIESLKEELLQGSDVDVPLHSKDSTDSLLLTKEVYDIAHGFLINLLKSPVTEVNTKLIKKTFLSKLKGRCTKSDYGFVVKRLNDIRSGDEFDWSSNLFKIGRSHVHQVFVPDRSMSTLPPITLTDKEINQKKFDCSEKYVKFMELDLD